MRRQLSNGLGPSPATFRTDVSFPGLSFPIRLSQSLVPPVSEGRGGGLVRNPRLCYYACPGHVTSFL